eukprot:scaffold2127_cov85-Cylindrotheca_fusiformis.AAC.6
MEHANTEDVWIYTGQDKEVPKTSILYQTVGKEAKIDIPSNVREIDNCAFYECHLLEGPGLCEGLERIGNCAFFACKSLTEVEIPSTVTVIGDGAFYKCKRLGRLGLNEGLERKGKSAFFQCESLTGANVPSTVKVIDDGAFNQCSRLESLGLNEGLERIGESAFFECEALKKMDVPSTVKVIDDCAFNLCISLERLVLNEGLQRIGEQAFLDCFSLSHIRIPRSVDCIATDAFLKCRRLISHELPDESSLRIDLSGCLSLVNLAGPISTNREEFFQSSKLGSLVDDEDDLIRKLNDRFVLSPLNKLCYYQSYQSSEDAMARLRSLMEEYQPLAATKEVDEFGMTPLHVLSLSQTTNLDMLLAVMDAGKAGHMVGVRDSFGSTSMDYLCMNRMPNSTEVIRSLFQTRYDQLLGGLEPFWKSAMLQAIEEILAGDWSLRKSKIGRVIRKYERKEILSLMELFLFKMKIGEDTSQQIRDTNRQRCRIMSGAAVVMPYVLRFLDKID